MIFNVNGGSGVNISDTTAIASHVLNGDIFYTADGARTEGTMPNGSATTPATTIAQSKPSMSWNGATLTASVAAKTQNVTPTVNPGYIASGTAGTISLSANSNTATITTKAATTVAPTEAEQTAVASGSRLYFSGALKVGAISSTYVGSGITQRSSSDLTASGGTVTAPAGYYSSAASKSVASATLPTAAEASRSYTNKATIGRSTAAQYINIPAGYQGGGSYTVSAVANMTLPTSATTTNPSVTNKATISRSTSTQYIKIPTGYNTAEAQYTISATANGSAATPETEITQSTPSMSWDGATLTASVAKKTQNVTPTVSAGYVSSGTAGTITLGASSNTTTLVTQAARTVAPKATAQTIIDSGSRLYFSGDVKVAAVTNTETYEGAQASKDSAVSNKTFDMGVNNLYRYVTVKGWDYINQSKTSSAKKTMKCAWNTSGLTNCMYVRYTSPDNFRVRTIMFVGTDNRTSGYIDFPNNTARHDVDDVHWSTTLSNVTDWCPAANRTASAYLNPGSYIDIPVGGTTTGGYGSVIICVCGYYI